MKKKRNSRGIRIGAISSQTVGNLSRSPLDHAMKVNGKNKGYFSYCDDVLGLARTKAEATRDMIKFIKLATEKGLVVKATAFVSKIGINKPYGAKRKKRKRQRSHKRKEN